MSENDKPKIKLSELSDMYDIENDTKKPEDVASPEDTESSVVEHGDYRTKE